MPASPGSSPTLNFEYEQHFVPTTWPSVPDRHNVTQHLDIAVTDLSGAVEWALDQGATLASVQPQEGVRVLFDPESRPFCLSNHQLSSPAHSRLPRPCWRSSALG
jgi:hypothetical protein